MKLFVLQAGFADVDKGEVLTPGSGDGTMVRIPVPMYLVEHDDGSRTLIDTGMHPVHVDDPGHTFAGSPLADAIAPIMRHEDRLEHRLGELGVGVGDTPDPAGILRLPPGSFMHLRAGTPHYARIEVETVLQINGIGPLDRIFVTSKGDARGK